jgi:hypothetical protein
MTDSELKQIIIQLRDFTYSRRRLFQEPTGMTLFFLNVIEITCSLAELGLYENRPISEENEYWFKGAYHMDFWDADIEMSLYGPLVEEVKRRNFFRS